MSEALAGSGPAALLGTLKPKTKQSVSTDVLNIWITQAEGQLGDEVKAGRLGWLVASSVAIAAVQRALDADGRRLFLLKGGTLLQHRLTSTARATYLLAYFDRPGTSNGTTGAIKGRLEHLRGSALGFCNLANYITHSLLETGRLRPHPHPQLG